MPQLLAPAIIWVAGELTITVSVAVATEIAQALILAVSFAVAYATKPSLPKPGDGSQNIKQAIPQRQTGFGTKMRLFGSYMLYEVSQNNKSYDVIAYYHGRLTSIDGFYLTDDVVTLDGSSSGIVQPGTDGRYAHGSDQLIYIDTRLGLGIETAYPEPIADLPTGIWTADHRGDGIASAEMICKSPKSSNFQARFPNQLPQLSIVANMQGIFDLRDPGQTYGNIPTYISSNNPVVQLMNYMTNVDIGIGADWDMLFAKTSAINEVSADYCDVVVTKKDLTTEPRYSSCGLWYLDNDPVDVISTIIGTFDGWMCPTGDGLVILPGQYTEPTLTIPVEHILGVSAQKGIPDEQVVNQIIPSYCEPLADFKMLEAESMQDLNDIGLRGVIRSQSAQMPWVHSFSQCRRLTKRLLSRSNAKRRGTTRVDRFGFAAVGHRFLRLQHGSPASIADIVVEVTKLTFNLKNPMGVTIEWILADPTIDEWDPATEEGTMPPIPAKVEYTQIQEPQNVVVTSATVNIGNGSTGQLALVVKMDYDSGTNFSILTQYRPLDTANNPQAGWTASRFDPPFNLVAGRATVNIGGVFNNQKYEVAAAFLTPNGTQTDWAPLQPPATHYIYFTTGVSPDAPLLDQDGAWVYDQDGNLVITQ